MTEHRIMVISNDDRVILWDELLPESIPGIWGILADKCEVPAHKLAELHFIIDDEQPKPYFTMFLVKEDRRSELRLSLQEETRLSYTDKEIGLRGLGCGTFTTHQVDHELVLDFLQEWTAAMIVKREGEKAPEGTVH